MGEETVDFTLNYSRPSAQVITQYYNFLRFGFEGYTERIGRIMEIANFLAAHLTEAWGYANYFELISEQLSRSESGIKLRYPNLVLKVKRDAPFTGHQLSEKLSEFGYTIPVYPLPADCEEEMVMRLVIKENVTDMQAIDLLNEIGRAIDAI